MKISRIAALLIGVILSLAGTTLVNASEPYFNIIYDYSDTVSNGNIRYMSQIESSKYFNSKYWGKWDGSQDIKCGNGTWYGGPIQECGTCSISMTLSYLGIDKTPEDILNFGSGITISNTKWGGATYKSSDFITAFNNYMNGNGKYSPPVIHLNNYTSAGHYVVVIDKVSDNVYKILDPAQDKTWNMTIKGTSATYTLPNGKSKSDTVKYAYQYYKADAVLVKPFKCTVDTKTNGVVYEDDVTINGWAIYGKGITKVEAKVNGQVIAFKQVSRADVAKAYPGYPTGKEGFTGAIPASYFKNGTNKLVLTAYSGEESFTIKTINLEYNNPAMPEITDVFVTGDAEGYTIFCTVSDDLGIGRVQFPTWTAANGQDDLDKQWFDSEFSKGSIEDNVVTYRVNYADHNYESGEYITHIYAFDISGNKVIYSLKHIAEEVLIPTPTPETTPTPEPTSTPEPVGCGDNLTYEISEDMVLTIDGSGDMYNWTDSFLPPWHDVAVNIKSVVIKENVAVIDAEAFNGFTSLESLIVLGKETIVDGIILEPTVIVAAHSGSSAEMLAIINALTFRALGGDINSDAVVSAADALMILKHAAGLERFADGIMLISADMNSDANVDASDALEVLKKAAGLK